MRRIAAFMIVCLLLTGLLTACRSRNESYTTVTTVPSITTMPDMGEMLPDAEDTIDPTAGANTPATDGTIDPTNGANDPTETTGELSRMLPRHRRGR